VLAIADKQAKAAAADNGNVDDDVCTIEALNFCNSHVSAASSCSQPWLLCLCCYLLQVNHGGRIGVKLCNRRDNIDQACFNQFQLQR
jgi:hypothetical protein